MTRNFVPLHVFLRHESEWQCVRETAARGDAELQPKAPIGPAYGQNQDARSDLAAVSRVG